MFEIKISKTVISFVVIISPDHESDMSHKCMVAYGHMLSKTVVFSNHNYYLQICLL
jgi:hypothetical protein